MKTLLIHIGACAFCCIMVAAGFMLILHGYYNIGAILQFAATIGFFYCVAHIVEALRRWEDQVPEQEENAP